MEIFIFLFYLYFYWIGPEANAKLLNVAVIRRRNILLTLHNILWFVHKISKLKKKYSFLGGKYMRLLIFGKFWCSFCKLSSAKLLSQKLRSMQENQHLKGLAHSVYMLPYPFEILCHQSGIGTALIGNFRSKTISQKLQN